MSTEELEAFLRMDFELDGEDGPDMDTILYIMEVLAKRQKEHSTYHIANVDDAWASFEEHYKPCSDSFGSLYDFDEVEAVNTTPDPGFGKKRRFIRRFSGLVAAFMIIVAGGSLITNAVGIDMGGILSHWMDSVCSFGSGNEQGSDISPDMDLKATLDQYNIPEQCIPTWSPDGYVLDEFKVDMADTSIVASVYLAYYNDNSEYNIDIHNLSYITPSVFEENSSNESIYERDGIEYHIVSNDDYTKVLWLYDDFECAITGDFSEATAKKIIDSICEGE